MHPLSRFAPSPLSLRGRGRAQWAWRSQFHGCTGMGRAPVIRRVRHPTSRSISMNPIRHRQPWPRHPRHRDRPRGRRAALGRGAAGRWREGAGGDAAHRCSRLPAIEAIARNLPEAVVGVGTVLNADDARRASEAGARFAVSPGYTSEVGGACKDLNLPLLPGVATSSEIMAALADGFSFLKLFPAEAAGGIPLLKAWASPFGQVSFCPRGHQPGHRPQLPGFAQCALRGWLVVDACRRHAPGRLGAYHPVGTRHTRFARASLRARWGRGLPPYQRTFTRMPPSSGLVSVLICSR